MERIENNIKNVNGHLIRCPHGLYEFFYVYENIYIFIFRMCVCVAYVCDWYVGFRLIESNLTLKSLFTLCDLILAARDFYTDYYLRMYLDSLVMMHLLRCYYDYVSYDF